MQYLNINNVVLVNTGLLILRLVIGITFIGHGTQKLFGWFGGPGLKGFSQWLETTGIGFRSRGWSVLAGLFELIGGLLLSTGVLTAVAAILICIVMLDAILIVHRKNGYWIDKGGYEYNVVVMASVIALAFVGPGAYVLM